MVSLSALWLPILVASVLVFLSSWILHTLLPLHKKDFGKLPNESAFMQSARDAGISPGQYMFPCPDDPKDWMSEEFKARAAEGPVGIMFVGRNGMGNMGAQLGQHFAYTLVISLFVAYLAAATLEAGSGYLEVFRVTGTAAFLGYAMAHVSHAVWWFHDWSMTFKYIFDGLVYALLTAGAFGWLWPV